MATIVISFKDVDGEGTEALRPQLEKGCQALAEEFPETTRFEVTVSHDGNGYTANGHVTGRNTEAAGQAEAPEGRQASDKLLDALERQLRKTHDTKIFGRRREAQRSSQRRRSGG